MKPIKYPFFRKILVPIIHNCTPDDVITAAGILSNPDRIILVGVIPIPKDVSLSEGAIPARQVREKMREIASLRQFPSHEKVLVSHKPWSELYSLMQKEKPDLLLLNWADALQALGVTAEEVLSRPACDIVLLRGPIPETPGSVLVPVRGGPYAELAVRLTLAITHTSHCHATALHLQLRMPAGQPGAKSADVGDAPFRGLARILDKLPEIDYQRVATDQPGQMILDKAMDSDLVILGATAQKITSNISLGPIADRLLREHPRGVMVVKTRQPMPVGIQDEMAGQRAISILVDKWFAENSFHADEFADLKRLVEIKSRQGVTISLALPALNEEETIGTVIKTVKTELMDKYPLLDEIVLIDSDSSDATRQIAESMGIPVFIHQQMLTRYGARRGKGEALWKSLYATRGDIILWIDTDIVNIDPRFVYGLAGTFLVKPAVQFVKGYYRRPLKVGEKLQAGAGGRVTELTARPLLNLFYPELSGVVQPLSGEYGGRRKMLERLPFSSGYGVEIGLLIDVFEKGGLPALAQVDLQERIHHNQELESLSKMSFAIIQTVIHKLERRYGQSFLEDVNKTMKLIRQDVDRFYLEVQEIAEYERPPMIEIPEYREAHQIKEIIPQQLPLNDI